MESYSEHAPDGDDIFRVHETAHTEREGTLVSTGVDDRLTLATRH